VHATIFDIEVLNLIPNGPTVNHLNIHDLNKQLQKRKRKTRKTDLQTRQSRQRTNTNTESRTA